jgi:hypothetical protein
MDVDDPVAGLVKRLVLILSQEPAGSHNDHKTDKTFASQ